MKTLLPLLFVLFLSCKAQEKIIEDPKMFKEVYIWVDSSQYWTIKRRFIRNDLPVPYIEEIVNDNRYIVSMPYSSLNARKWWGFLVPYNARETAKSFY